MNRAFLLVRVLLFVFCSIFTTLYVSEKILQEVNFTSLTIGVASGLLISSIIMGLELLLKKIGISKINLVILGLFCGYLAGNVILLALNSFSSSMDLFFFSSLTPFLKTILFSLTCYLGVMLTLRAGEELQFIVPFIKLEFQGKAKKNIIVDFSTLLDTRIIELASTGLLDNHLIIPQFLINELNLMNEHGDEAAKAKSRRCFEVLKKLETLPDLNIRYVETDFSDVKEINAKLACLARMLDATMMTADLNRPQQAPTEGIRTVNIHELSKAFRAIPQSGEFLTIKIQRRGKEAGQGVGYLDDGTMVVVNGGEEFIFETIRAQILSVKSTSSGRMIFCNAAEESSNGTELIESLAQLENTHKNYFSLKQE